MALTLQPPVEPMLARLARTLPSGDGTTYEPKWDGFRCLAFVEAGQVVLQSRNGRVLQRYFPEVVAAVGVLPDCVLDGELLVRTAQGADFPALLARLHPAPSRVAQLADATPAELVAFDVLEASGDVVLDVPFRRRRERLAALVPPAREGLRMTPETTDAACAERWLDAASGEGVDGVVAKDADLLYLPGRRAMTKVKRLRSADCVVAGVRVAPDGGVGSLLLGLYDGEVLRHVGVVPVQARAQRRDLAADVAALVTGLEGHPWEHGFALEGGALGRLKGTAGRWTPDLPRDWVALRPERVAEVTYDHVEGWRFRHPARFLRWRPDRDPASCTVEQLS